MCLLDSLHRIIVSFPMHIKNSVQIRAYYLNEADCEMFQKKPNTHVSPRSERNNFSWMEHLRKSISYLDTVVLLLVVAHFHSLLFWEIPWKARCGNKVSVWLSLQKFRTEWMETPIQHNDYACEMWKEITENAMKDEIELRVAFCCCWQNGISCKLLHYNQYFFSHSISLLLHFRPFNAVCRLCRFQSFCIWMDADLNCYECVCVYVNETMA